MLRKLLDFSRHVLILAVAGSLLLMISILITTTLLIANRIWQLIQMADLSATAGKTLTSAVIQALDMYLVAALCYIIAAGIYRLFIAKDEDSILERVKIERFVDLKKKIISVVVVALGVAFLGLVAEAAPWRMALGTGAGIALVVAALGYFYGYSLLRDH